ncbi:MAG: hypothetical protein MJ236_00445 [Clostridia bacterium]|nr:hypothetical protein [Clostridia bacterium]
MLIALILAAITCLLMILSVLFFPKITIKNKSISTYWIIVLIGAIFVAIAGKTDFSTILSKLTENSSINPLKILVLFISMTILSIYLDELGFFRYLANITLKRANTSQFKLFLLLYITVSILTVFTSNDIIILSFTPFICYFSKNAKISPIPYLAAEFVAANTWSMALIIGNPTNIYLATAYNISFVDYVKIMIIPTIISGIVAFLMLYLMFRKKLSEQINGTPEDIKIKDKTALIIGLTHLAICTIFLAIGSYIDVEMWIVSFSAVISLFIITLVSSLFRKTKPTELKQSLKRAPWQLIPFVLSMFVIILVLSKNGITNYLTDFFGKEKSPWLIFKYGYGSFIFANIINNIPMSVLFSAIIEPLGIEIANKAVFASIVGSNIGAFMTPIGALAGIMWSSIIASHDIKFKYIDFLKIGIIVAIPTITVCLVVLGLFI